MTVKYSRKFFSSSSVLDNDEMFYVNNEKEQKASVGKPDEIDRLGTKAWLGNNIRRVFKKQGVKCKLDLSSLGMEPVACLPRR
jgi:hypothetical protein